MNYCVFLRGVNVNGVAVKMDALKEAFRTMGHPEAKTILATGNVVIRLEGDPAAEKANIERALSQIFHYEAYVFLRSGEELEAACAAAKELAVPEGFHCYLLILEKGTLPALAETFRSLPHMDGERFVPLGQDAFWLVPKGSTVDSPFGNKALGSRRFKSVLTSRNMNTIEKVLSAMR